MRVGIIGLPQSGKSCLFYLLTGHESVKSPIAVVKYAEKRLMALSRLFPDKKIVYPEIVLEEVRAMKEETPKLIDAAAVKDVELFIIVTRTFTVGRNASAPSPLNPFADVDILATAFMLTDLEAAQKSLDRIRNELAKGKKDRESEGKVLARVSEALAKEIPMARLSFSPQEAAVIRGYKFLSQKPIVTVINIAEEQLKDDASFFSIPAATGKTAEYIRACLKAEYEIRQLETSEQALFMQELGIETFCDERVLESCFRANRQIFFFTVGEKEVKAWPIEQGASAHESAGKIHSDMQKGFIKAQVIAGDDLLRQGGFHQARASGALRLEGKEYIVQDGDVIEFKFSA